MTILQSKRLAIIGIGNIGRILLERLILSGVPLEHPIINDSEESRSQYASHRFGGRVCALTDEALCDVDVFLHTAPLKSIIGILESLRSHLHEGQVILSFAAAMSLHRLEVFPGRARDESRCLRCVHFTPSEDGGAVNPSYPWTVHRRRRRTNELVRGTDGRSHAIVIACT